MCERRLWIDSLFWAIWWHAIREYRKIAEKQPLTLQSSDYAHAVHELNKAIDRADGLLLQ